MSSSGSVVIIDGQRVDGTGQEQVVTRKRILVPYHGVAITDFPGTVEIVPGTQPELTIAAADKVIPKIRTVVRDQVLEISSLESFATSAELTIRLVAVSPLRLIHYQGAGDLTATGLNGQRLHLVLSGAADMRLSGAVQSLDVELEGSGTMDLRGLQCSDAQVTVQGAGEVQLTVHRHLKAVVEDAGTVVYFGHPQDTDLHAADAAEIVAGD